MMKIKCIDNKGNMWFKEGKEYRAWKDDYGNILSESELDETYLGSLNNPHGVFEIVEEEKSHPHADLMLKYAMIAQYDDKPWEHFEGQIGTAWYPMRDTPFYEGHNYRLKPQVTVVQTEQIWIDGNGMEVTVTNSSVGIVTVNLALGGDNIIWTFTTEEFLQNFKRKS